VANGKGTRIPVAAATAAATGGALAAGKVVHDRRARRRRARQARYRLEPGEPIGPGIRRIARGQIERAVAGLDPDARGELAPRVHDARKSLKRLRALVRLVRDDLAKQVYRRENDAFREIGRAFSDVRDATVLVETLEDITARYEPELPDGVFTRLREQLVAERDVADAAIAERGEDLSAAVAELELARARVAAWPLPEEAGADALKPALRRIRRRGRKAWKAVRDEPNDEHLHELRKRTKDVWYTAQIARPMAPKRMRKLASRAHDLSTDLGDDHDLATLSAAARRRSRWLGTGELELLDGLIGRRRGELQRRIARGARRLYRR
jgi:CHAD domain-containing protein